MPESFDKEDKDGDAYQEEEESRLTKALEDEKKMKSLEATNRAPHYIYIYIHMICFLYVHVLLFTLLNDFFSLYKDYIFHI